MALKFVKNKTYYLQDHNWKLKYVNQNIEGYYNFKVTEHDDPEENWIEYSTKDGTEIILDKKLWNNKAYEAPYREGFDEKKQIEVLETS